MKIYNVEQGTPEWYEARLGKPTASSFDKILTPTGKPSTSADTYRMKLLAEILTGKPAEQETNVWMERGKELEQEAADFYSMLKDVDLETIGFVTDDAGLYGCSPDRLIGDDGLLEIKCPAPQTHVKYLLSDKIDMGYYPQVQGQLLVTGRKWCDWLSYHPDMKPVIIRVERDEAYIASLEQELNGFCAKMQRELADLKAKGAYEAN